MARRSGKARAKPAPTPAPPVAGRDIRRWIYATLDLVFASVYATAIAWVIPNRLLSASIHLWTFPVLVLAMGIGMIGRGPRSWWTAVIAGSAVLLSTILLIIRLLVSAAFLAGVYGAFGKAAASFALVMVAIVIELVALLPIVQVKYLMTRVGRRAYGMLP